MTIQATSEWDALADHVNLIESLKELLGSAERNQKMSCAANFGIHGTVHLDFARERLNQETLRLLQDLAERADLPAKVSAMFSGERINATEGRAVRHVALRSLPAPPEVHAVQEQIKNFAESVRCGTIKGITGKPLTDVVCIGIGGSYLGPEFVYESLRTLHPQPNRKLRFLANVDPIDVERALEGLQAEQTLVIVISKTFTTAETMLNAKILKKWLIDQLGESAVAVHMAAVSTALDKTKEFGLSDERVFGFWDWVGGRFSVTSAVGLLPLSLHFGWGVCESFLSGARAMDDHFISTCKNSWNCLPVALALISVWNTTFLGYHSEAVLPYCQALCRFVAHIQQVQMESNGKSVTLSGETIKYATAPITFGEPGTNGQHSFYQLLHQGTVIVPAEFIGFVKSQSAVPSHDELMSNFFAQPDALAYGSENADPHRKFPGNRPSLSLLLPICDAFFVGLLLALYEHKTAAMGFIWGINSFDQWGVELGKVLAKEVRNYLATGKGLEAFPEPTQRLLRLYRA